MPTAYDELPDAKPASPYDALPSANPYDDLPALSAPERIDSDPFYAPTRDEFKAWRDERAKAPDKSVGQLFEAGGAALGHVAGKAVDVLRYSPELVLDSAPLSRAIGTVVEAGTRGTFDLGRSTRDVIDKFSSAFTDEAPEQFKARYRGAIAQQFAEQDAAHSLQPQASASLAGGRFKAPAPAPPSEKELDRLYADYKLERDFERFTINRALDQVRAEAAQGKRQLAQSFNVGTPAPNLTEPLSTFVGLEDLATLGAGALAEQAARAAGRELAGGSARAAGRGLTVAGEAAAAAGRIPERAASGAAKLAGASDDAAELVRKSVSAGQAGLSVAPGVGVTIPGVSQVAQAATGAKVGGKALQSAGEAVQAVGRVLDDGPSRLGALERISKDGASPLWLRKAASAASGADPALKAASGTAGAAVRGAAGGAAAGGAMGFVLSGGDPEAAAAGIGGGIGQGAFGGLVNHVRTRTARATAEADADLARWMSGKSADEVNNLASLRLTREQALKVADVERWARGVLSSSPRPSDGRGAGGEGDITFRYVTDAQFKERFGSSQRGAQVTQGERPEVIINTGFRGERSLFHETMHAIDDLDAFEPNRMELNRRLFTETTPDGQVLSRGLFDATDLAAFEQSYRARLGDKARTEWDAQPAPERARRIRSEVRAESFANYVSGASGREILTAAGGWRRRLADAALLSDHASTLGRMRRGLEAAGVEFKASGEPSDLFFKNGRPITNSPEVDAALRDYLRAKRRITDRLVAGDDDTPAVVFDEHAIRSNAKLANALAAEHPDWDGWQKNPDGSVKFIAGMPVLATERDIKRVQTQRVERMIDALKAAPDLGEPGAVRDQGNGHWKGTRFSEAQVKALLALPDDVLPPSMKQRIAQLNQLAGDPGRQIVIDYNAALKNRRYSSGISPTTRIAVPLSIDISKAGNFVMDTLDVTHFIRKLGQWQAGKPRAFDAWGGDVNAFTADVFKYLDNHQRQLPGATDLDADAGVAIVKRNVIKDLFNIGGPGALAETGGAPLSTKGGKDNLIRSRRFDRIQRITPGEGTPFPIDYYKQKANFLPIEDYGMPRSQNRKSAAAGQGSFVDSKEFDRGSIHINIRGDELDFSKPLTGWVLPAEKGDFPNTMSTRYGAPGRTAIFVPKEWVSSSKDRPDKIKPGYIPKPEHVAVIPPEAIRPSGTVDWSKVFKSGEVPGAKFLPATNPAEVMQVVRDQSGIDLARSLGLPPNTGRLLADHYFKQAAATSRATAEAAAQSLRAMTPAQVEQLQQLILAGGLSAARDHLTRMAQSARPNRD
jgi:hypothetical protein